MKIKLFNFSYLYDNLFCLLILFLPFSAAVPNIICIVLLAILLFNKDFKLIIRNYLSSSYKYIVILILFLIIKEFGNYGFQNPSILKLFYLPIVPLLVINLHNINKIKISIIASSLLTILLSLYYIYRFYSKFNFLPLSDGWATNYVLILERPYLGILCVLGAIVSFDVFQRAENKKLKATYLLSLLISVSFIFFISIRISAITIILISGLYIFFYSYLSWLKKIGIFLSLFIIIGALVFLNKNLSDRFFLKTNVHQTVQLFVQSEPRVIIWECAGTIISSEDFSYLSGNNSFNETENKLVDCYNNSITDFSKRNWFVTTRFNTHNQFLDLFLSGGIIALLLLLVFIAYKVANTYKNFAGFAVIVSLVIFMCVENIFHRQLGCYIFSIFTALYYRKNNLNVKA